MDKEILVKMAVGIDLEGVGGEANIGGPLSKIYRREKICKHNLEFPIGLKRMQDTVFNISFFRIANEIRYIDIPVYYYRIWEASAVRRYSANYEFTAKAVAEALEKEINLYSHIKDKQAIIQYKKILLLAEIVKLSYVHKECKLSLIQKIKNIERLCQTSFYNDVIHDDSDGYLSLKHILWKRILKWRRYWLAYVVIYIDYYYNLLK